MKALLLGLAIVATPVAAQPPLYTPIPSPAPVLPVLPPLAPPPPLALPPLPPVHTPQYIYQTYPYSTQTPLAPSYVIVPMEQGLTIFQTAPNSTLYDITKPALVIK